MAAVFPQAAACQENVTGPIEIPDHLLVRQTIDDTLHEALDIDGITALLERIESGRRRGPLLRHHRAVGAVPRDRHRPALRLPRRRGVPKPADQRRPPAAGPGRRPGLHRGARPGRHRAGPRRDRRQPRLPPTTSTTCCPRSWPSPPGTTGGRCGRAGRAGAGARSIVRRRRRAVVRDRERPTTPAPAFAGDHAAATRMVRGHLESVGHHHRRRAGRRHRAGAGHRRRGVGRPAAGGFRAPGPLPPSATDPADGEWVARRLLARMHSYSRRSRRDRRSAATRPGLRAVPAALAARRARHPADRRAGLAAVIEQLQGFEAAAVAWEPELLARRLRHYEPGWLDQLCHDGAVAWLRLAPRPGPTPTGPWPRRPRRRRSRWSFGPISPGWSPPPATPSAPIGPSVGATAEIIEVLGARGPSFAADLAAATRRLPDDIQRGLWDGVTRGLFMCDGFSAIRARVSAAPHPAPTLTPVAARATRPPAPVGTAGRWALVPVGRHRHRPRRPRRSGRRATPQPVGRRLPRPGRAGLPAPAVA